MQQINIYRSNQLDKCFNIHTMVLALHFLLGYVYQDMQDDVKEDRLENLAIKEEENKVTPLPHLRSLSSNINIESLAKDI